jgi:hypothetical protein
VRLNISSGGRGATSHTTSGRRSKTLQVRRWMIIFRRVRRERESTPLTAGIRLKIPRNRYVETGLPADVKKAEKHMHEMLGHLGWKTIKRGLAQVQGCEGLVKLIDGVEDNRHCTACKLTKSKLPPFPTGKTFRLKRVGPLDKC